MSNAEEKSSKARTHMLPLLREMNSSSTTFRRAVSVLLLGRYANLKVLCRRREPASDRESLSVCLSVG